MNDRAPARTDNRRDIVSWLNSGAIAAEMKRALPDHVPVDWFLRCAQTALLNNPNLAQADKATLLRELVSVAQLGLVLDPQLGEAWLIIDRHGKVQRRVGYQGLRKLVLQSGLVTGLNAQAVYRHDICEISLGDSPSVKHTIKLETPDRGEIIGYYAVGRVAGTSEPVVEWLSQRQIDEHRDRYSDAAKGRSGPWTDPLGAVEMARKTVFRRLAKWLPKSPLVADALAEEDRADMREINPRTDEHAMLPAPASDDPMDDVVAAQSRQEAPQSAPASQRTEIAPERSAAAAAPQAPTAEPRKRGRPSKADIAERTARNIITEINATAPVDIDVLMDTHAQALSELPDELRTEVVTAAHDRMAEVVDKRTFDDETSMAGVDTRTFDDEPPLADEHGEPVQQAAPVEIDEAEYKGWYNARRAYAMGLPTIAHLNKYRPEEVEAARERYGDDAADHIDSLFDEAARRLKGGG